MNNPTNFHSINEYAKEPSPSTSTASSPATTAYSTDGDSQRSTSSQRSKTLKARIKRNILNDSIKLSATSTASAPPSVKGNSTTKECPVFEATSALASLGVNSPLPSFNGGQGGGAVKGNMTVSSAILSGSGSYASAPVPSTVYPSASFMGQLQQQQQQQAAASFVIFNPATFRPDSTRSTGLTTSECCTSIRLIDRK